mgnify:CR=1 FL=1
MKRRLPMLLPMEIWLVAAVRPAVERHLEPVEQDRLHEPRPAARQDLHGLVVAEAVAGVRDVAREQFRRIAFALENDAALRPVGVRFLGPVRARDEQHLEAGFRELKRRRAAGNAAAEDQDVGVDRLVQSIFGPTASMRSTERSARTRMSSGTSIS